MTSAGSAVRVKKKRSKGKIVFKNWTKQGKKRYKETESSVAGSRARFICTCKKLLVISKQFFSAIDAV